MAPIKMTAAASLIGLQERLFDEKLMSWRRVETVVGETASNKQKKTGGSIIGSPADLQL
jgi:hypothetical protein